MGNYETQKGFRSNDGETGTKIVDAVIYLSEGRKSVVVDSKASLVEFINFTETNNEEEKQKHLNAFLSDVKDRIKELTGKYNNLEGLMTPDFTIMFIPFMDDNFFRQQRSQVVCRYCSGVAYTAPGR